MQAKSTKSDIETYSDAVKRMEDFYATTSYDKPLPKSQVMKLTEKPVEATDKAD